MLLYKVFLISATATRRKDFPSMPLFVERTSSVVLYKEVFLSVHFFIPLSVTNYIMNPED